MAELLDPDCALELVLEHSEPAAPVRLGVGPDLLGLTMAETVKADRDYPPFDRAMMDGVATQTAAAGGEVAVIGEVAAGAMWNGGPLRAGEAVEIMTGAPVPEGCDAVVPREVLTEAGTALERRRVRLPETVRTGQNIMRRGLECQASQDVLAEGITITPLALSVLAFVGCEAVLVRPRPRVAVLTTGDEIAQAGAAPGAAGIRDSNGPLIEAMLRRMGVSEVQREHARDDAADLKSKLDRAMMADVVILSGGVSAGKYDLVPGLLEQVGARIVFHKVSQRPGKPLLFAVRARSGAPAQLMFGLPGNPLASQLGMHRYVAAALRKWSGQPPRPLLTGRLTRQVHFDEPRTVFQLARAATDAVGSWEVEPLVGEGSSDLFTASVANAVLRFETGCGTIPARTEVRFDLLD